jgi:hypothetical protein
MTVNILRHSHAAHINGIKHITFATRVQEAHKMGHSISKQLTYDLSASSLQMKSALTKEIAPDITDCYIHDQKENTIKKCACVVISKDPLDKTINPLLLSYIRALAAHSSSNT